MQMENHEYNKVEITLEKGYNSLKQARKVLKIAAELSGVEIAKVNTKTTIYLVGLLIIILLYV